MAPSRRRTSASRHAVEAPVEGVVERRQRVVAVEVEAGVLLAGQVEGASRIQAMRSMR